MRHEMHNHLEFQWAMSSRKNLRLCGKVPIHKEGYIYLFKNGDTPVISGLMRCNSASACIVCSSRIAKERGDWLGKIFENAISSGYKISMLTLTVPHKKGDSLENLLLAMEAAYTNVQGTIAYKQARMTYEASFVRSLEVTWGKNGWHPHFHIAIIHRDGYVWDTYRKEIADAWCRNIQKDRTVTKKVTIDGQKYTQKVEITGLRAPKEEIAVHILENADNKQRAEYLTKMSGLSSLEFTNGRSKEAGHGNINIWQLHSKAVQGWERARIKTPRGHKEGYVSRIDSLKDNHIERVLDQLAMDEETHMYIKLWHEYEQAITGKKIISVSRGMAEKFGVAWKSENEIAGNEFSGDSQMPISYNTEIIEPEFVGAISTNIWKQVVRRKLVRELRLSILQGYDGVCDFLEHYGIEGSFIPLRHIELQYNALDALKFNRDMAHMMGDNETYDLLQSEVNVALLMPEIQDGLQKLEMANASKIIYE